MVLTILKIILIINNKKYRMIGIEKKRIVNYEILELLGDHILCSVCVNVCYKPYTCTKCETNYCTNCLIKKECEKCDSSDLKYFPEVLQTFYKNLKIRCRNQRCEMILGYDEVETHQVNCLEESYLLPEEENKDNNVTSSFMKSFENVELEVSRNLEVEIKNQSSKSMEEKVESNNCINDEVLSQINQIDHEKEFSEIGITDHDNYIEHDSLAFIKLSDNFLNSIHTTQPLIKNNEEDFEKCSSKEKSTIIRSMQKRIDSLETICQGLVREMKSLIPSPYKNIVFNNERKIDPNTIKYPSTRGEVLVLEKCDLCTNVTPQKNKMKCNKCNRSVCVKCNINCAECEKTTCRECAKCEICKTSKQCCECKSSCAQCIKNEPAFCSGCVTDCSFCNNRFCKRCCAFKCKDCQKIACLMCSWNCKVCFGVFCNGIESDPCKICGVRTCKNCLILCKLCDKKICKNCFQKCSKCSDDVCNKCSIKSVKVKDIICKACISY